MASLEQNRAQHEDLITAVEERHKREKEDILKEIIELKEQTGQRHALAYQNLQMHRGAGVDIEMAPRVQDRTNFIERSLELAESQLREKIELLEKIGEHKMKMAKRHSLELQIAELKGYVEAVERMQGNAETKERLDDIKEAIKEKENQLEGMKVPRT